MKPTILPVYLPRRRRDRVWPHPQTTEQAVGWFLSPGTVPTWSWCSQVSRGRVVSPVRFALCFHLKGWRIIILFPWPSQSPPRPAVTHAAPWYFWLSLPTAVATCARGVKCSCPELCKLSPIFLKRGVMVSATGTVPKRGAGQYRWLCSTRPSRWPHCCPSVCAEGKRCPSHSAEVHCEGVLR